MSMVMSEQPLGCFLSWESVRPHPVYQMMCPFSLLLGDYNPHLRCCCFMSGIAFTRIACKPLKTNCPLTPDCECTIKCFVRKHAIQNIPIHTDPPHCLTVQHMLTTNTRPHKTFLLVFRLSVVVFFMSCSWS